MCQIQSLYQGPPPQASSSSSPATPSPPSPGLRSQDKGRVALATLPESWGFPSKKLTFNISW
jgi:hypothetical protein